MRKANSFKKSKSHSGEHSGHNLTSLVDCFAIILVYLLLATSFGEIDLDMPKEMVLPKASEAQALTNSLVILVNKNQSYEIGGRTIALQELGEELKKLSDLQTDNPDKKAIVIQADRQLTWGELNPVVVAGLQSGFSEVQFAVIKEEKM